MKRHLLPALALATALTAVVGATPAATATSARQRLDPLKLPLSFVPNTGQLDRRVRFSAQAGGASFWFTTREAVFSFAKAPKTLARPGTTKRPALAGVTLRLGFTGANPHARVVGQTRLGGTVDYLVGSDRARWHTNVSTFGELRYRNLWPGIDLVFHGAKGSLEYRFVVRPGASVDDIGLAYRGATGLSLDRAGNLRIGSAIGPLTDTAPVSYQLVDGRRTPVASRYLLRGRHYGFALGRYDRARTLVIDPGLVYSTFLGGTGDETGDSIAVDSRGNAYIAGGTYSLDFPTTAGAFQNTSRGAEDVFVTKLNSTGSALVYSTYLGGTSDEPYWPASIAVDDAGNAYVTGTTYSPDFPVTPGAYDTTFNGPGYDAFVTKLNSKGSGLVYSTFLGGNGFDGAYYSNAIALDREGNAFVTGFTDSPDYPTTPGAFRTTFGGGPFDAFVTKLDKSGRSLDYSTFLGGSNDDDATGIAVTRNGNATVTGYTSSLDFPVTPNAVQPANAGGYDAFVTTLNQQGSGLRLSTYLGGTASDNGGSVAVDQRTGEPYVVGDTNSTDYPVTPGAFQPAYGGGAGDAFVTKLTDDGEALVYSTYLGGALDDFANDIAVDPTGHAHVVGFTNSIDYPTTQNAYQPTFNGAGPPWFYGDGFVTKLNRSGSGLDYSTYLGSTQDDLALGVAVDWAGKVYVTGATSSPGFPTTPGAFDQVYNGAGPPYFYGDAFVSKLDVGARPESPCSRNADSDRAEQDQLAAMNQKRAAVLMPPLTMSTASSNAARAHSCDERDRGEMDERGSDGSQPADRQRAAGMLFTVNAESLGVAVAPTEADALAAINSDLLTNASLTANALNPAFKQVGIGVAYVDGVMVLTADFTG